MQQGPHGVRVSGDRYVADTQHRDKPILNVVLACCVPGSAFPGLYH